VSSDFDPSTAFAALRERAPRPRFASAVDVRRRGHRRTRLQVGMAAVAVVVLLVGAGALAAGPLAGGPTEPATTAGTRPPTRGTVTRDVPDDLFLRESDLPTGFQVGADRDEDLPQVLPANHACVNSGVTFSAREHRRTGRQIVFAGIDAMRRHVWLPEEQIQQNVTLYDPGWAAPDLADHRAWIDACRTRPGMAFEVLATDLGGDESVLYRVRDPSNQEFFVAIVRVGDRLTGLRIGATFREDTVRDLAVRAGERLGA
jgi:hypothetical protein